MKKRNAVDELAFTRSPDESGTHQRVTYVAQETKPDTLMPGSESTITRVGNEVWQRVAYWLERLPESDSRRRLLQLAQLRRDANLADAVLRNL